jgi:F-type H+-transporting ATPase subunit gamma
MASLKEIRSRIASVAATQKITKALQMVAASKLRRAREAAENARPYAQRMAAVIANLAAGVSDAGGAPALLTGTGSTRRELVVVATADRGLAGGFNSSIVRMARDHIAARTAEGREVTVITIGRKARDQLRRALGGRLITSVEAGAPSFDKAQEVADLVIKRFNDGHADVVTLIYNHFVSVVSQTPTIKQLVPAQVQGAAPAIDLKGAAYEYEPEESAILETLLPRNITTQVLAALMENQAGFFAAQMAAMDNATRNAGELIAKLTLLKNRTRQAQITKELIEIISGAEAL